MVRARSHPRQRGTRATAPRFPPAAALALTLAVAIGACAGAGAVGPSHPASAEGSADAGQPADLTVLAAASLKAVLADATASYRAASPEVKITVATDSSAALAVKIEQGAPADVFLSADTSHPARLAAAGLASGSPVAFAGNLLTVIVPADNPSGIASPADLGRSGAKIIAAGDAVPITGYAARLVANLSAQPGYPEDFVAAYGANVVSREDNAAAIVAKIALGEGDAGIVYATDAASTAGVVSIPVPTGANVPATYAGVVVKASPNQAAATAFLAWLAGPDGQAVFEARGFLPPPGSAAP